MSGSSLLRMGLLSCLPLGMACSEAPSTPAPPSSHDPRLHRDPTGALPLESVSEDEADRALVIAGLETDAARAQGVDAFVAELKEKLGSQRQSVPALDRITADRLGDPLPGMETVAARFTQAKTPSLPGIGRAALGLSDSERQQYERCPLDTAPAGSSQRRCEALVQEVVEAVSRTIASGAADAEQRIRSTYPDLTDQSYKFVAAWAIASANNGALTASAYAAHELKAAAVCDDNSDRKTIAYSLGVKQGIELVYERRAWALNQLGGCAIGADAIAEQVRVRATARIDAFVQEHALCPDTDLSLINPARKEIEVERERGIRVGIAQQVEVLRNEMGRMLHDGTVCAPPPPPPVVVRPAPAPPPPAPTPPPRSAAPPPPSCSASIGPSGGNTHTNFAINWSSNGSSCTWALDGAHQGAIPCAGSTSLTFAPGSHIVTLRASGPGGSTSCDANRITVDAPPVCYSNGSFTCRLVVYSIRGVTWEQCACRLNECCSPIVVDLDDDGVEVSSQRVPFDLVGSGRPQSTTWVGERDGLVVLDRDGDGRISTGAELFGDQTPCAGRRCYDGVAALTHWDDPAQGGNGDQVLDARDAVFRRLALWLDRNHDGVSQPSELAPLAQHGILSLNLAATYPNIHQTAGTLTAKLEVRTTHGPRSAYDAWFKTRLNTHEMAAVLAPPAPPTRPGRARTPARPPAAECVAPAFPHE
ncbi:MAG: hypothetical protein IPG96_07320 [Proteobacteria bacterium]|nr:hypothetical protein [Pseudomonadota bacterium]